jgi:polysaccharide chain length determinant protein (PEP-CTERM system associated)
VGEYHAKLVQAEEALKEFRSANIDAQPGTDADVGARLSALQTRIEQATQQMRETEIKKRSLEKQLSGEAETSSVMTREGQYRARLAELQSQLVSLRLSYHETYPDIVRLRHQIEDLNEAITAERQRRQTARTAGRAEADDMMVNNPMYQQLKHELSQTQVQLDMLHARISEARRELQDELERGKRVHGGTLTLAELMRDYQVNRDLYQDLVKRRESARVSMNIDRDNQGLTFKIQEPATLPRRPVGPRFWHFSAGGMILAIVIPVGLLYLKVTGDSRIRLPALIPAKHNVPVLATVPHTWSPTDVLVAQRDVARLLRITVAAVLAMVVGGLWHIIV